MSQIQSRSFIPSQAFKSVQPYLTSDYIIKKDSKPEFPSQVISEFLNHRNYEIINGYCCFKPLICYTAIDN